MTTAPNCTAGTGPLAAPTQACCAGIARSATRGTTASVSTWTSPPDGGGDAVTTADDGEVYVIVGYLATHPDGYEARIVPDRTRAELYAMRNHATLEPMFVRRKEAPE